MELRVVICGLCIVHCVNCLAFESRGNVELQHRQFYETPIYEDAQDGQTSVAAENQFYWSLGDKDNLTLTPFARLDNADDERTHWDLREAKWVHKEERWDFEAGNGLIFWGVAESQHLVDVINQRDAVEDIIGDVRLGQPMLHGRYFLGSVTLEGFVLPYFRERAFSEPPGRLRLPIPVDQNDPIFESSDGRHHVDYALRGSFSHSGWDVGLSYFKGTNREPLLIPAPDMSELTPYYEQITQYGLDLQITTEKTLWKLEARYRRATSGNYFAYVAGLEHTFYQLFDTSMDLGVLLEYNWDERGDEATTPYEDDLFVGTRIALNDEGSTEALLGVALDLGHDSYFGRFKASTRYGSNIRIGLEAYLFGSSWKEDFIYPIRHEDYVQVSFKYYF